MAQAEKQKVLLDKEKFSCSICLDTLRFPVSVPCGHNYCIRCIEGYWDQNEQMPKVKCPQCSQTFDPRPELKKNLMLGEVVAILKKTALEGIIPEHCYAGPGDVGCDSCSGRKQKAVETCLQCLVSYCATHVQPHYRSPAFKKHKRVKASSKLQENICVQERIQEREEEVKVLQREVETINKSADKAARNSDTIFAELISSIEKRRSKVREQIRDQQKHEVSRAEEQGKRVGLAVTALRRRQLEQLSHTENSYNNLSRISESTYRVSIHDRPLRHFDGVTVAVSKMRGKLEAILKEEGTNVSKTVKRVDVLLSTPEPKTRAEFLKYAINVTMDPNTAHQYLSLSEGNLKVLMTNVVQSHPQHPDRFVECWQVLGTEPLTGRHYWEAEWGGDYVDVAVAYPDIARSGDTERRFGLNAKTWCLQCWQEGCYFRHREIGHDIPINVRSRVGVYLDHSAGILSFYSVSDSMVLLKRIETTFTRPLLPGFWVCDGATMEMCHDIK